MWRPMYVQLAFALDRVKAVAAQHPDWLQKQPFAAVLSGDMKNHHTDGQREFAYDRDSAIGRLDKALQEAPERGWRVVQMKDDWRTVFPDPR